MKQSWDFAEGAEIADGRTVLEPLGGGGRYEVYLVLDASIGAEAVAKVLRPDRTEDERAVNAMRREAMLLDRLEHPVLVRGLASVLERALPTSPVEVRQRCEPEGRPRGRSDPANRRGARPRGRSARGRRAPGAARSRAPRHQAEQRRHDRSAAAHRPRRRAQLRGARGAANADRHRRLHGAGAMRPRFDARRAARRRLGRRHHALPRAHGPPPVLEARPARQRPCRALPPARGAAAADPRLRARSLSPARCCACSNATPTLAPLRRRRRPRSTRSRTSTKSADPSTRGGRV